MSMLSWGLYLDRKSKTKETEETRSTPSESEETRKIRECDHEYGGPISLYGGPAGKICRKCGFSTQA